MDRDGWLLIIGIFLLLLITNLNTAYKQKKLCIEEIKDAVIKNTEISCVEYLQPIEE